MTTVLATIFVLGVLVFIHELGHFLVAKWAGIRVERFSLGFPPKMIGKTVGETEYCLSWIPLGGYVKMAGENPEGGEPSGDPGEFMSKSVGVRSLVILAGPLMNFGAAIFIFGLVLFAWGRPVIDQDNVIVGPVVSGSPAEQIGLQNGDIILAVDHQDVSTFVEMADLVHARPGDSLEIFWRRGEDLYSATVLTMSRTLQSAAGTDSIIGLIGVGQGYIYEPVGLVASIAGGFEHGFGMSWAMLKFLGRFATGGVSMDMVSGPVGIAKFAGEAARMGFEPLLSFMAILSINLALLNILPIPVLDGGHLVFLGLERLRRKPVPIKYRAIAQQVGMVLLLALILRVTYQDIVNLFSG